MDWRYRTFRLWAYVTVAWTLITLTLFAIRLANSIVIWPSQLFWLPVTVLSVPIVLLPVCWLAMWSSDRAKALHPPYWPRPRTIYGVVLVAILVIISGVLSFRSRDRELHSTISVHFEGP
jgi:hypothetical protein